MRKLDMLVPDKAMVMAATPSVLCEYANMSVSDAADLIIDIAALDSPAEQSPLSVYQRFAVHAVMALDASGNVIPAEDLTIIPAVTHETTSADDPDAYAWGIYGVLLDSSIDHLADCPTKPIADAVALAINTYYGKI